MTRTTTIATAFIATLTIAAAGMAHADDANDERTSNSPTRMAWDIEVDPIAYALDGYSFHIGLGWDRLRLDLGAFGLAMPEAVHGNEGVAGSFRGFGAKLDLFPWARQRGAFIGLQTGLATLTVRDKASNVIAEDTTMDFSVRVGYRFEIGRGFFVSPWIGVGYARGEDINVGGATWKHNPLMIFPTVHVGYRGR